MWRVEIQTPAPTLKQIMVEIQTPVRVLKMTMVQIQAQSSVLKQVIGQNNMKNDNFQGFELMALYNFNFMTFCDDPEVFDTQVWANSVDPDQIASEGYI